jgi:D-amino-acid dehydrogenase
MVGCRQLLRKMNMQVAIIGAGVTGVTTADALLQRGYSVTIFEKHPYAAMETSFANGGQLSASNAEVWNNWTTVTKGLRWIFKDDAPLLMSLRPSWHKYSWLMEFISAIGNYESNTIATVRLAIDARRHIFEIAKREGIDFDLKKKGILHFYRDERSFRQAERVNKLLNRGGLERYQVSNEEIKSIEPSLNGSFYGGFFTPSDATGDIYKFTSQLANACARRGARFVYEAQTTDLERRGTQVILNYAKADGPGVTRLETEAFDAVVVCAGVGSRKIAARAGDRVNIYPVKGYSITVFLDDEVSKLAAPEVSLLDDSAKIVTSRLGLDRFRVAGTAEINGYNRDIRVDRVEPLITWTRTLFPGIKTRRLVPWSGLRPMMPDMMPAVRQSRRGLIYYNTGHGHLGWTLSAGTAQIVASLIDSVHVTTNRRWR